MVSVGCVHMCVLILKCFCLFQDHEDILLYYLLDRGFIVLPFTRVYNSAITVFFSFLILLLNYILLIMLLQLSQFFPLCLSTQHLPLPQAVPPALFMSIGHTYKLFGYCISYTVLDIPMDIISK